MHLSYFLYPLFSRPNPMWEFTAFARRYDTLWWLYVNSRVDQWYMDSSVRGARCIIMLEWIWIFMMKSSPDYNVHSIWPRTFVRQGQCIQIGHGKLRPQIPSKCFLMRTVPFRRCSRGLRREYASSSPPFLATKHLITPHSHENPTKLFEIHYKYSNCLLRFTVLRNIKNYYIAKISCLYLANDRSVGKLTYS